MTDSSRAVRVRITAWYVGIFAAILLLFGAATYLAVARQIGQAQDRQLVAAAGEVEGAIRSAGLTGARAGQWDTVPMPRIPGRDLYLFDADAVPVGRTTPPAYLPALARAALAEGQVWARPETQPEATWRVYARRFAVDGQSFVAVVVASAVEVEDQYSALLTSFLLAALAALGLVAVGGWVVTRRALVPLDASLRRMRRFVADASHELRTPVAVLRTTAEVALQRPRTDGEYRRTLEGVVSESDRLARLVEGLLMLAAADEDRLPIRKQPVFLDDLLVEVAERLRTMAMAKGVTLELGRFEEAPVVVDPDLARQLLLIVLENAVKYTPPSGQVVAEVTAGDGRCRVMVRDTGPGIPPEVLPHVFERFYRADPARERAGGSGLGLAIARRIAEVHGADLQLTSTVGKGTTVVIEFCRGGPLPPPPAGEHSDLAP